MVSVYLALLCLATLGRGAQSWATNGHERIARIAQDLLKGKHRDQLRSMMHGDLVDVADWEQKMTLKYLETAALHFHRQEPEWTCAGLRDAAPDLQHLGDKSGHIKCDGHLAEGGSLYCALAYFFEHFASDTLLRDFPKPELPINTPKKLDAIRNIPASDQTPANYLRWLTGLIGDLHQPLHWLKEKDYGRELKLIYKDREYTLFQFWEEEIPKLLPNPPAGSDYSKTLDHRYGSEASRWGHKLPTEHFREWAKQVAEATCTQVYSAMEVNHADGTRSIDNPFRADDALIQKWTNLANEFTAVGGIRLAFVLNEILEHKKHKAAHKEGRGVHHRHRSWKKNLGTNAFIAAIVVPLTLFGLRFHLQLGGPGLMQFMRGHLKT